MAKTAKKIAPKHKSKSSVKKTAKKANLGKVPEVKTVPGSSDSPHGVNDGGSDIEGGTPL